MRCDRDNLEDLLSDVETFNAYLQAQLEGNAGLGVKRIDDAKLREGLMTIKTEMDDLFIVSSLDFLREREIGRVSGAVHDNRIKSDKIYRKLKKID